MQCHVRFLTVRFDRKDDRLRKGPESTRMYRLVSTIKRPKSNLCEVRPSNEFKGTLGKTLEAV